MRDPKNEFVVYPGRIRLWSVDFVDGGKSENLETNPRRKARTKYM